MMLTTMEELRCQNEVLHESFYDLQQQQHAKSHVVEEEEPIDPQPLAIEIWDVVAPKNFKPPSFVLFDGKIDPREHIITININDHPWDR